MFSGWSGDLNGSVNPTNLTMDGNKSVTANFSLQPISFPAAAAPRGAVETRMGGRWHAANRDQRAGNLERCPRRNQSLPGPHNQPRAILSSEIQPPAHQFPAAAAPREAVETRMGGRWHAANRDQRAGNLERCPRRNQSLPGPHNQPRAILSSETMKIELKRRPTA